MMRNSLLGLIDAPCAHSARRGLHAPRRLRLRWRRTERAIDGCMALYGAGYWAAADGSGTYLDLHALESTDHIILPLIAHAVV